MTSLINIECRRVRVVEVEKLNSIVVIRCYSSITHNPSSMKAIIDFSKQRVEVDCTFYNQEEVSEIDTPCE